MSKEDAILMGPFVGELYWEAGRFAPMLPFMRFKKYKKRNVKYIICTREERFDLYGKYASVLVPLKIDGDYEKKKQPNCFRLNGLRENDYLEIANKFKIKYSKRFNIMEHIYPNVKKGFFDRKFQYDKNKMMYKFAPRENNYNLINDYLPKGKPLVVIASRFRIGFKRNWEHWQTFYDMLYKDKDLNEIYNFIICGKVNEYVPDEHDRFLDMNKIQLNGSSSLIGILLAIMENAFFTFGSQSAIPNISLLYKVPVLEFGCQKSLHTKTYNVHNSSIVFIDDCKYDITPEKIYGKFKKILTKRKGEIKNG